MHTLTIITTLHSSFGYKAFHKEIYKRTSLDDIYGIIEQYHHDYQHLTQDYLIKIDYLTVFDTQDRPLTNS